MTLFGFSGGAPEGGLNGRISYDERGDRGIRWRSGPGAPPENPGDISADTSSSIFTVEICVRRRMPSRAGRRQTPLIEARDSLGRNWMSSIRLRGMMSWWRPGAGHPRVDIRVACGKVEAGSGHRSAMRCLSCRYPAAPACRSILLSGQDDLEQLPRRFSRFPRRRISSSTSQSRLWASSTIKRCARRRRPVPAGSCSSASRTSVLDSRLQRRSRS